MYAIIDTESTGLFDFSKPADADGQPRMAEFVMILADADLNVEQEYHVLIKPDGWEMSEGATKINGLTTEHLNEHGIPVGEALTEYRSAILNGRIIVAHNAQYDTKILRGECRRAGIDDLFEQTPNICTMRALTDVCKIPPNGNRGGYKFPKLSEACVFFDMKEFGDHSALNDARACLGLLREMKKRNIPLPEAKVHFAKNRPA